MGTALVHVPFQLQSAMLRTRGQPLVLSTMLLLLSLVQGKTRSHGCTLVAGGPGRTECLAFTLGKWDVKTWEVAKTLQGGWSEVLVGGHKLTKYPLKFSSWLPSSTNFQTTTDFCLMTALPKPEETSSASPLREGEREREGTQSLTP